MNEGIKRLQELFKQIHEISNEQRQYYLLSMDVGSIKQIRGEC